MTFVPGFRLHVPRALFVIVRQLMVNQNGTSRSLLEKLIIWSQNQSPAMTRLASISEKMRGQTGSSHGAENAQDGISMIQTAEGALQEAHAILQRMWSWRFAVTILT